ncbi:helix-turn-helix domain-containing protein [Streptomyces hydrogenans]
MNHSKWRSARSQRLTPAERTEYEKAYAEAELALDLGQMVYDRRTELGLTQTELAQRAGMKQPAISRIEGGGTVPTVPLLRRLADALDADLNISFSPRGAASSEEAAAPATQEPEAVEAADEQVEPEIAEAVALDEGRFREALASLLPRPAGVPAKDKMAALRLMSADHSLPCAFDWPTVDRRYQLTAWLVCAALLPAEEPGFHRFLEGSELVRVLSRETSTQRNRRLQASLRALNQRFDMVAARVEDEAERLADA